MQILERDQTYIARTGLGEIGVTFDADTGEITIRSYGGGVFIIQPINAVSCTVKIAPYHFGGR